jgi:hypothetical protein
MYEILLYLLLGASVGFMTATIFWVFYSKFDSTYFITLDFIVCEHMRKLGHGEEAIRDAVSHYDLDNELEKDGE